VACRRKGPKLIFFVKGPGQVIFRDFFSIAPLIYWEPAGGAVAYTT